MRDGKKEKIAKARKQLIIIGVVCVAVVIFALWLATLQNTFERNRQEYATVIDKNAREQFINKLREIKEQLKK